MELQVDLGKSRLVFRHLLLILIQSKQSCFLQYIDGFQSVIFFHVYLKEKWYFLLLLMKAAIPYS